jgi:hypothetical protein
MDDSPEDTAELAPSPNGLISRLRDRGRELGRGRRLVVALPGWDDLGDGRGLWARFAPYNRRTTMTWAFTADVQQEHDEAALGLAQACEEVLIGTPELRTPLADEPEISNQRAGGGPLGFSAELGALLGVGGGDGPSCVKRILIRGEDDAALYAVHGALIDWSGRVESESLEVAAGE